MNLPRTPWSVPGLAGPAAWLPRVPLKVASRLVLDWSPLLVLPLGATLVQNALPPWIFMWMMAASLYCGVKWLSYRRDMARQPEIPLGVRMVFLFGWIGLSLRDVASKPVAGNRPVRRLPPWLPPVVKLGTGMLLLWGIAPRIPPDFDRLRAWIGMTGCILMLHFGAFHLLALALQAAGYGVRPLMLQPLGAPTIEEFWGRRWNTAFSDFTERMIFRPLARCLGTKHAVMGSFLLSGVIHELAITVPAGGGYGLPTLYFVLQAVGLLVERGDWLRARPGLRRAVAWGVIAGPAPILFPPPFLHSVILPMLDAIGATSLIP